MNNGKWKICGALLAFFVGTTGAHRYYLGYKKEGGIQTGGCVALVLGYSLIIGLSMSGSYSGGSLFLAILLTLYGLAVAIRALVDFIRILTGGLKPADGSDYSENQPIRVVNTSSAADQAEALERLAKLRDSGVLSEEEFQKKKQEILNRM